MNGRKKSITLASVLLLAISLLMGSIYFASAESEEENTTSSPYLMGSWRMRGHSLFGVLNEDQRQELKETIEMMREEGATSEEIRNYIKEYLDDIGIEFQAPELTEEQLQGLEQLRAEIQELIKQRTEELGIDFPLMENGFGFGFRGWLGRGFRFGFRFRGWKAWPQED